MITERDIKNLLYPLVKLKFINTKHFEFLIPYRGVSRKADVVRRRMRNLIEAELVQVYRPDMYSKNIYFLTEKGAKFCENYFGLDEVKFYKRNNKVSHHIKIVDFYIAILELQSEGYKIEKIALDINPLKEITEFKPDIFINVLDKNQSQRYIGFVEIDMGTESLESIMKKKIPRYKALYDAGAYQKKYGKFPIVYFITKSLERAENLRKKLSKEDSDIIYKVATFEVLDNITKLLEE